MKKKTDTEIGAVWQKICQKMNYLRKKCLQEGNGYAIMYTRKRLGAKLKEETCL